MVSQKISVFRWENRKSLKELTVLCLCLIQRSMKSIHKLGIAENMSHLTRWKVKNDFFFPSNVTDSEETFDNK